MHRKKMIAPVVVCLLVEAYYLGIILFMLFGPLPLPLWLRVVLIAGPVVFIGMLVFVLKERMEEIRSGVEDDLSQY